MTPTPSKGKSPFGKKRNICLSPEGENKKSKSTTKAKVIICNCESEELAGFVLMIDGYAESVANDAFYNRKQQKNIEFLEAISPVLRVVNVKETEATSDKMIRKNSRGFPFKSMVVITSEHPTKEQVKEFFDEIFLPAFKDLAGDTLNSFPVLDEDDMETFTVWSDILPAKDWNFMIREFGRALEPAQSMTTMMRAEMKTLYSIFHRGKVPPQFVIDYSLNKKHLDPQDKGLAEN